MSKFAQAISITCTQVITIHVHGSMIHTSRASFSPAQNFALSRRGNHTRTKLLPRWHFRAHLLKLPRVACVLFVLGWQCRGQRGQFGGRGGIEAVRKGVGAFSEVFLAPADAVHVYKGASAAPWWDFELSSGLGSLPFSYANPYPKVCFLKGRTLAFHLI